MGHGYQDDINATQVSDTFEDAAARGPTAVATAVLSLAHVGQIMI